MLRPYPLQEKDDSLFEFIADSGIKYQIYFLDYGYMFADYPQITCPVYSFNIDAIEGEPDHSPGDDRIGITVAEVMNTFFSKIDNVVVYVCDSMDERQFARKRKFDIWFYTYNDGSLVKEDGIAMVDGTIIYNAMLLHKNNTQRREIILAFNELNESADNKYSRRI